MEKNHEKEDFVARYKRYKDRFMSTLPDAVKAELKANFGIDPETILNGSPLDENGNCTHKATHGDNYGVSCAICQQVIEGYGYYGQANECKHVFITMGTVQICTYCQIETAIPESEPPKPNSHVQSN